MTSNDESWYSNLPLWIGPALAILILVLKSVITYAIDAVYPEDYKKDVPAPSGKAPSGDHSRPQSSVVGLLS